MEEYNRLHPRCPNCDMFVPWLDINKHYPNTTLCGRGVERKIWSLMEEEAKVGADTTFDNTVINLRW